MIQAKVIALSKSASHTFNKYNTNSIHLLKGLGVEGDAHMGEKVKHRSRVARDPNQPNLRQVHLMHAELFEEVAQKGFTVSPGQMGENITTKGIDLLSLPTDSILKIGQEAEIQITGLRNPCRQIDSIQEGLMKAVLDKDEDGNLIRKAGIMGIVLRGGEIKVGDGIEIKLPAKPHRKLERV
ncbi:MAG: MOSC domain-containing protein [Bacteroidota bacterium]